MSLYGDLSRWRNAKKRKKQEEADRKAQEFADLREKERQERRELLVKGLQNKAPYVPYTTVPDHHLRGLVTSVSHYPSVTSPDGVYWQKLEEIRKQVDAIERRSRWTGTTMRA